MMTKKILITGVCGFIFSNFIKKVLVEESNKYTFIGVDKLVSSFNYHNMVEHPYYKFYLGDIADEHFIDSLFRIEKPDIVINGAAESFVDASIVNARPFIRSNVYGTQVLVDASVKYGVERFVQISTDEVYGHLQIDDPAWDELSNPRPRNPYSVSKYASELVVYASNQAHGLPYNITRCCNVFGPAQPNRNLIPRVIACIDKNESIPIHGNGKNIREWLYVDNKCDAIMFILKNSPLNQVYNIGSGFELSNVQTVNKICDYLGKGHDLITFVPDRKGHDFRYSLNCDKLKSLGWEQSHTFDQGFVKTMEWYKNNAWYFDV